MANPSVENANRNHLMLDTSAGISLDEPDLVQMRLDRLDRTRATMKAVSAHVASQIIPKVDNRSREEKAAVCIQSHYRGHLGRKKYIDLLYKQFEKEEAMRLEKTRDQVEEGELLVENHRLEVQLSDNSTTRRNKSRQYLAHVITIQRGWRAYKNRTDLQSNNNNDMSPQLSESDDLSESDSTNGVQAMSLATPSPDDSDKALLNTGDNDTQSDSDSSGQELEAGRQDQIEPEQNQIKLEPEDKLLAAHEKVRIEPEPDSIVSDYSEMADPLKEHLANVQIIQKEDLDAGNTMSPNHFSVGQKIMRSPTETEEEYTKRLRKINYLSLAQEFAELKKVDATALPFDLHKGPQELQDRSPMSEVSSSETESERYLTDSCATTPMETGQDFPDSGGTHVEPVPSPREEMEHLAQQFSSTLIPNEAWLAATSVGDNENLTDKDSQKHNNELNEALSSNIAAKDLSTTLRNKTSSSQPPDLILSTKTRPQSPPLIDFETKEDKDVTKTENSQKEESEAKIKQDTESKENKETASTPSSTLVAEHDSPEKKKLSMMSVSPGLAEKMGDFDVYNIESTLPQMDWDALEEQLKKAAEEERQKRSRQNDREEIRRKLAMPADEDYYCGERMYKKPNLQMRLQSARSLQFCYMNEATCEAEGVNGETGANKTSVQTAAEQAETKPNHILPAAKDQADSTDSETSSRTKEEEDEDFFAKQARLQDEARMALASVRPMAHMQLEVEKQLRKKSPIAEMVGVPAIGAKKLLSKKVLQEMNVAQLQVVVNDLHTQIETLNEELVRNLVKRDDHHMEQDSMLVDIEDLTRRAQEIAAKVNNSTPPQNPKPKKASKKK